tara:strand:+ start:493 stop:1053 length:561 start_codon:yes stop_codon:yes gene_type:complete
MTLNIMKTDLFSIPMYEIEVDLDQIVVHTDEMVPTFESGVPTSMNGGTDLPTKTTNYISSIIKDILNSIGDEWKTFYIQGLWRNKYDVHDYQLYHIHPRSQWSFIIYESVEESKTMFINPSLHDVQNHFGFPALDSWPIYYIPKVKSGTMLVFPSFLGHQVRAGNKGTTIAGNVAVEYLEDRECDL